MAERVHRYLTSYLRPDEMKQGARYDSFFDDYAIPEIIGLSSVDERGNVRTDRLFTIGFFWSQPNSADLRGCAQTEREQISVACESCPNLI